jgi:hypothetical protein
MCLYALVCAAFFSRAARNDSTWPPAPPPGSAFQPRTNTTGFPGQAMGGAAWRCLRQWGTKSGRLLPGRGVRAGRGAVLRLPVGMLFFVICDLLLHLLLVAPASCRPDCRTCDCELRISLRISYGLLLLPSAPAGHTATANLRLAGLPSCALRAASCELAASGSTE